VVEVHCTHKQEGSLNHITTPIPFEKDWLSGVRGIPKIELEVSMTILQAKKGLQTKGRK
jgi:hypothetical protein